MIVSDDSGSLSGDIFKDDGKLVQISALESKIFNMMCTNYINSNVSFQMPSKMLNYYR